MENADYTPAPVPMPVQILSILLYAGFAISVSVTAMVHFWPAGLVLGIVFAYYWGRTPSLNGGQHEVKINVEGLTPKTNKIFNTSSGNASFDKYREDLLKRLEEEQRNFEEFLERLRAAQDQSQFDEFMAERANVAKAT